jgi:hypothetical protein
MAVPADGPHNTPLIQDKGIHITDEASDEDDEFDTAKRAFRTPDKWDGANTAVAGRLTEKQATESKMAEIPYQVLAVITQGFSSKRHVGSGGFADVFRGSKSLVLGSSDAARKTKKELNLDPRVLALLESFPDEVAVKRNTDSREATSSRVEKADRKEVLVCAMYRHRSLCCMLAACSDDGPNRCVVFEFCGGGNLFDRLHPDWLNDDEEEKEAETENSSNFTGTFLVTKNKKSALSLRFCISTSSSWYYY